MIKLLKTLVIIGIPAMVWGSWAFPKKDYGLRVPVSLGELCNQANVIIIGEVIGKEGRIRFKKEVVFSTTVTIRVWENLKENYTDTLIRVEFPGGKIVVDSATLNIARKSLWYSCKAGDTVGECASEYPQAIMGETTLVFLDTMSYPSSNPHGTDTFNVTQWALSKFTITNDSMRFYQYSRTNYGIGLNLAKGVVKSGIEFPAIVDAKIDTVYEEAKAMYYKEKKGYLEIRQFVYDKLEEIAKFSN